MGKKYFTLSFDDGLEQDKRVIRLMRQYGLKGTFNLNAGLLGTRGEVKGLGTFSFQDCPEGVKHKFPFSYVQHNRIPQDEVRQVYEGMEIATHGFRHEPLGAVSEDEMRASVDADKAALEKIFGTTVVGLVQQISNLGNGKRIQRDDALTDQRRLRAFALDCERDFDALFSQPYYRSIDDVVTATRHGKDIG